jgi:hypothetical protein
VSQKGIFRTLIYKTTKKGVKSMKRIIGLLIASLIAMTIFVTYQTIFVKDKPRILLAEKTIMYK